MIKFVSHHGEHKQPANSNYKKMNKHEFLIGFKFLDN
jgi:hypothetical protein